MKTRTLMGGFPTLVMLERSSKNPMQISSQSSLFTRELCNQSTISIGNVVLSRIGVIIVGARKFS
jgi:hypothetical protein